MTFKSDCISGHGDMKKNQISLHQSTSSSEYKSSLVFLSILKNLKKINPKPLKVSVFLIVLQTLISAIFSILYFNLSTQYIDNCFKPLQNGIREHPLQYHLNGIMMISNIKKEYFFLKLINHEKRPEYLEFDLIIEKVYNKCLKDIHQVNNRFREKVYNLNFEKSYKQRMVNYYEAFDSQLQKTTHMEFVDVVRNNIQTNLPSLARFSELAEMNYDSSIFLIRNFPSYLTEGAAIYVDVMNEFANSDKEVNKNFVNLLIIFISICMIFKIYEVFQWHGFMNLVKDLLMIYLRINDDEFAADITKLKDSLKLMKDSNDKYFDRNAMDTIKQDVFSMEDVNSKANTRSKKGRKNVYSRLQGIPKLFLCLYYFSCSLIITVYFLFSYYNWTIVDKYIVRLTQTNLVFSNTFIYSSSVMFLEDMLLREKIIRNPYWEKINATLQTKNGRMQFFKAAYDKRMGLIANTSAINIVLDGIDDERKSGKLNQLLNGNLCEIIKIEHNLNESQMKICETMMNGALTNGLGTSISEFIKSLKTRELTLQYTPKDTTDEKKQEERIKEYIKSRDYFDMHFTEIFLHEILDKYYFLNNEFYNEYLNKELSGFYTFLCVALAFLIIFNTVCVYIIKKKIRFLYQATCTVFFLIPYDKIIKDERMIEFLKNLSK